jgi:hypothetical protein
MSVAFLIGAVVLTVIGNVALLRYLVTRPIDVIFED